MSILRIDQSRIDTLHFIKEVNRHSLELSTDLNEIRAVATQVVNLLDAGEHKKALVEANQVKLALIKIIIDKCYEAFIKEKDSAKDQMAEYGYEPINDYDNQSQDVSNLSDEEYKELNR